MFFLKLLCVVTLAQINVVFQYKTARLKTFGQHIDRYFIWPCCEFVKDYKLTLSQLRIYMWQFVKKCKNIIFTQQ